MTLADITGVAMAGDGQIGVRGGKTCNGCRLGFHLAKKGGQASAVQIGKSGISAADNFIRCRGQKKAHGRAHAGIRRHDDPVDAKLFGQSRGVKRGPTAKGDHGTPFKVKSAFRRVDTRGAGHVIIDNFDHATGRIHGVQPQPVADMAGKSGM